MSGLGRCPDLRNPDLGGSTVLSLYYPWPNEQKRKKYIYEYFKRNPDLLRAAKGHQKYKFKRRELGDEQ